MTNDSTKAEMTESSAKSKVQALFVHMRHKIIEPWFAMTSKEQLAVSIVVLLFLLGLFVRFIRNRPI